MDGDEREMAIYQRRLDIEQRDQDFSKLYKGRDEMMTLNQEQEHYRTSSCIEERLQNIHACPGYPQIGETSDIRPGYNNSSLDRSNNKAAQSHKIWTQNPLTKQESTITCCHRQQPLSCYRQQQTRRKKDGHRNSSQFSRLTLCLVILLSMCSSSLAVQSTPRDTTWIIENSFPTTAISARQSVLIPDLVAVSGHLFQYQIPDSQFGSISFQFQAREAGRNKLPDWLSFTPSSFTFAGIPLVSDQRTWYISLDVYSSNGDSTVPAIEHLFSIKVVPLRTSMSEFHNENQPPNHLNKTVCLEDNFYLSEKTVPRVSNCTNGVPPILVNLLTYPSVKKLPGAERASLLLSLSKFLGICPHLLRVDGAGGRSSAEMMKLWSQIVESGLSEYLHFTSTISLSLSCDTNDYRTNEKVESILQLLHQYVSEQSETLMNSGDSILYLKWFVSSGEKVLETSSFVGADRVHDRVRRQFDVEELPVVEITTVLLDVVSSLSSLHSSSSSSHQPAGEYSIDQASSSSPMSYSTVAGVEVNPSSTATVRETFGQTDKMGSTAPAPDSLVTISSVADVLQTTMMELLTSTTQVMPLSRVIPRHTNTAEALRETTNLPVPISSRLSAPISRVVPSSEPTLILTPSITVSGTLPSPMVSSSGDNEEIKVASFGVISMMLSQDRSLQISQPILTETLSTSVPPLSLSSSPLFSIRSTIEDLPTPTPSISSSFSSSFFMFSSFDLPDPTSSNLMLMPETTIPVPTPFLSSTTFFFSSSSLEPPFFSSSDLVMPETSILAPFTSMSLILRPTSSQMFVETPSPSIPASSIFVEFSSDVLLPDLSSTPVQVSSSPLETTTLILSTSTMVDLLPTSIVSLFSSDILFPETSLLVLEPTPSEVILTSSSPVLTPSSSSSSSSSSGLFFSSSLEVLFPTVEPTPSDPLTTILPEVSSRLFTSSSNNLLMPMSSEELTLSISIFTPSPLPSFSSSLSSSMDSFSLLSSPIFTSFTSDLLTSLSLSSSLVDIFVSSTIDTFPDPTSSTIEMFTESSFIFTESSSLFTSSQTMIASTSIMPSSSFDVLQSFSMVLVSELSEDFMESSVPQTTEFMLAPTTEVEFSFPSLSPAPTLTLSTQILMPISTSLPEIISTSLPQPFPSSSFAPSPSPSPSSPEFLTPSPSPMFAFCDDTNCSSNGICLEDSEIGPDGGFCSCFPDYTGLICEEIINNCDPNPCSFPGSSMCEDRNASFTCMCEEGFTGHLCEEEIDGCALSLCPPDATCINLGRGKFYCICPSGYTGEFCEDEIDPCDLNPCLDDEICNAIDAVNFTCIEIMRTTTSVFSPSTSILLSEIITISQSTSFSSSSSIVASSETPSVAASTDILSSSLLLTSAPTPTIYSSQSLTPSTPSQSLTPLPPSIPSLTPSPPPPVPSLTPSPPPPVPNESPILLNPLGTLIVNSGQVFQFSIPEETFYDAESGSTSFLSLTLLDYRGETLPNTTWVQINQGYIVGLPLSSEITNEVITDHLFILQARDDIGNSAHDFITIRILPLGPFSTLLTVPFDNEFEILNRNISQRIDLVQRLSSATTTPSVMLTKRQTDPALYNTEQIYIRDIFNTTPLEVSYKNLSIADLNCEEFYAWIESIYNFTSNEYTPRFVQAMEPEFYPTPTPRIEGVCQLMTSNIPPAVLEEVDVSDADISLRYILLSTVIPAACLALCCLVCGLCALCMYRRMRAERKYVTSRRLFLNRRPIILEGETVFPDRRGRPVILENDFALRGGGRGRGRGGGSSDEEEEELLSVSEVMIMPPQEGMRERLLRDLFASPPAYRLPPLYPLKPTYDTSLQDR